MAGKKRELRERLVLAILDAVGEDDGSPMILIGVGEDELRVSWPEAEERSDG